MQEAGVQPDKAACFLIQKCCKTSEPQAITHILQYMKESSLVLRYPEYLEALETLKISGGSDVLLRQVNPHFSIGRDNKDKTEEFKENTADVNSVIDGGLILDFLRRRNFVATACLLAGIVIRKLCWTLGSSQPSLRSTVLIADQVVLY